MIEKPDKSLEVNLAARPKIPVAWLRMGPDPWFATCDRCGKHVEPPPLPIPIDTLGNYLRYAMALHERCKEGDDRHGD